MDFFKNLFSSKPSSKEVARDRLKLILIHDRGDLSPELLERIKEDLLKVISNYVEIDCGELEIKMTQVEEEQGNAPALVASIPIKRMKN